MNKRQQKKLGLLTKQQKRDLSVVLDKMIELAKGKQDGKEQISE